MRKAIFTNSGTVDIFSSDWAAGDTTVYRIYTVTNAGHLQISPKPDDHSKTLTIDCDIRCLSSTQMIWNKPGTNYLCWLARFILSLHVLSTIVIIW